MHANPYGCNFMYDNDECDYDHDYDDGYNDEEDDGDDDPDDDHGGCGMITAFERFLSKFGSLALLPFSSSSTTQNQSCQFYTT